MAARLSAAVDTSMSAVRRRGKPLAPSPNWHLWFVGGVANMVIIAVNAGARVDGDALPVKRWGISAGSALQGMG